MAVIDAHQHVWDPARARYDWLGPALAPIDRAIGFEELEPSLRRAGVQATILVQSADNDEDTALMRETAAAHPQIAAIVAFAPLDDPTRTAELAAEFAADPAIVGVRNLIHDLPDPRWLLGEAQRESLDLLSAAALSFDLVAVLPEHLELVPILSERHPELRIVIDHLAKPPIGADSWESWSALLADAARNPLVCAKVSGLYSAVGDPASWTLDGIRPAFEHALGLFGAERLMYGGDWPISVTAGGYDRVWDALTGIFAGLGETERTAITGGTAESFYRIDAQLLARAVAS
ncbi:amidohydrolase family protein [Microbacteriaceae bacterium VKM Ac-2855]|nr:amidohydrolase family protein [Microbacteriaceae bacterium VKM Ac-2855]